MIVIDINGSDTDGVDAVRVAVIIAVIIIVAAIARGKHKQRPSTLSAFLDPIDHGR